LKKKTVLPEKRNLFAQGGTRLVPLGHGNKNAGDKKKTQKRNVWEDQTRSTDKQNRGKKTEKKKLQLDLQNRKWERRGVEKKNVFRAYQQGPTQPYLKEDWKKKKTGGERKEPAKDFFKLKTPERGKEKRRPPGKDQAQTKKIVLFPKKEKNRILGVSREKGLPPQVGEGELCKFCPKSGPKSRRGGNCCSGQGRGGFLEYGLTLPTKSEPRLKKEQQGVRRVMGEGPITGFTFGKKKGHSERGEPWAGPPG